MTKYKFVEEGFNYRIRRLVEIDAQSVEEAYERYKQRFLSDTQEFIFEKILEGSVEQEYESYDDDINFKEFKERVKAEP